MIVYEMQLKNGKKFFGTMDELISRGFTEDDISEKEFLYEKQHEEQYIEQRWRESFKHELT